MKILMQNLRIEWDNKSKLTISIITRHATTTNAAIISSTINATIISSTIASTNNNVEITA